MKAERDSQKSKVYKAERVLLAFSKPLPEIKDMERYTDRLFKMKRLDNKYPLATRHWRGRPAVKDGRGQRRALGGAVSISMPLWSRNEGIVLHELAHTITHRQFGSHLAGHGWQYCAVFLDLVLWMMGREAHDTLKASFKASRVRFTAPRAKRELTAAQRAALAARFRVKQAA